MKSVSQAVQNGRAIMKTAVQFLVLVENSRVAVALMSSAQKVILFVQKLVVDQTLVQGRNVAASKVTRLRHKA